jgi:O-acetyl-ADP-ribose deacetylase (regulator of RNase III)
MRYAEINRDILNIPHPEYKIAHCVSADLAMGAGVAKQIAAKHISEIDRLREKTITHLRAKGKSRSELIGKSLLVPGGNIFNLVTKEHYYDKPTYETLALSLHGMRKACLEKGFKKIAMPTIGCGLDRLEWSKVSRIIQGVFSDTDIDIVICHRRDSNE